MNYIKWLLIFVFIISLNSCGNVDLTSSDNPSIDTREDTISNAISTNSSTTVTNTTETSTTSQETLDNSSIQNNNDTNDNDTVNQSIIDNSIFDTTDAVYDSQACKISAVYHILKDNSFDPEGREDTVSKLIIKSLYSIQSDPNKSEVYLYHPDLTQAAKNTYSVIYEDDYKISFDQAWVDNANNIVYIRTPKNSDDKYQCFKYILNDTDASKINGIKVYR